MCSKLNKLLPCLILISYLICDTNFFVFTQNNTLIKNNKTNDDYVYDYESDSEKSTTVEPKHNETVVNVNDDYVYDYTNTVNDNTTNITKVENITKNITSFVTYVTEDDSEYSTKPSNQSKTTSSVDEEDLGYEEEEDETCDNESILTKMLTIHEQNRNKTFMYKQRQVNHVNETFERLRHVRQLFEEYFAPKKGFGVQMLAFVSSIDIILTPECFASFFSLISGFRNNKLWANKFMDTMGRPFQTGSGDGKHSSFGEYEECLDIESPDDKGLVVKGQYCLVKVKVPYPSVNSYKKGDPYDPSFDDPAMTPFTGEKYFNGANATTLIKFIENLNIYNGSIYRLGLCTPHFCKRHEIDEFINKVLYPITGIPLEVDRYCITREKSEDFTVLEIISMAILTLLVILTITSTGIEIYNIIYEKSIAEDNNNLGDKQLVEEEPYAVNPYYYTFSLVTNSRELFARNKRFAALDTIRLFVILHIYVFSLYNTMATIGIVTLKRTYATYPSQVLELDRYTTLRNTLFFDILFIMSGFLLSNGILGKLQRNGGKFNFIKYFTNRYFRFAIPLLGSVIFFYVLPLIGSGPIWDEGTQWVINGCYNPLVVLFGFLFVSNYNDQFGIMQRQASVPYCNPSTWLVSALFQLHIIIPIFVIIYYKNPKRGLYVAGGGVAVGMLLSVAPTLIFNILPQVQYLQIESFEELFTSFTWYHLSTTQYIVSFLVGVIGGYFLRKNINLPIEYEVIGWVSSGLAIITVYMWSNTFWKPQKSAPLYSVLLWFTFGKLAFSASFTWIFFCLCTGRAVVMNYLLSWPNFGPFARLSFSFFMVHFIIVIRRVFTVRETIAMTDGLMIENSIIDIMVTFILAYIFYSLVEAPFNTFLNISNSESAEQPMKNGGLSKGFSPKTEKRDFGHFQEIELEEDVNTNNIESIRI